jgi:hypothetical protein
VAAISKAELKERRQPALPSRTLSRAWQLSPGRSKRNAGKRGKLARGSRRLAGRPSPEIAVLGHGRGFQAAFARNGTDASSSSRHSFGWEAIYLRIEVSFDERR